MKHTYKIIFIFAILGILLGVVSAILFCLNKECSSGLGALSTIISIILGVVSIFYSWLSGKETLDTLNKIEEQNRKLVEKINNELGKQNYDAYNIEQLKTTGINNK